MYFIPLLTAILVFHAAVFLFILFANLRLEAEAAEKKEEIGQLERQIQVLAKQREIEPSMEQYRWLREEIVRIKAERRNWNPVLAAVSAGLPAGARIASLSGEAHLLIATIEFDKMTSVAGYIADLKKTDVFEQISVRHIQRNDQRSEQSQQEQSPPEQGASNQSASIQGSSEQGAAPGHHYIVTLEMNLRQTKGKE